MLLPSVSTFIYISCGLCELDSFCLRPVLHSPVLSTKCEFNKLHSIFFFFGLSIRLVLWLYTADDCHELEKLSKAKTQNQTENQQKCHINSPKFAANAGCMNHITSYIQKQLSLYGNQTTMCSIKYPNRNGRKKGKIEKNPAIQQTWQTNFLAVWWMQQNPNDNFSSSVLVAPPKKSVDSSRFTQSQTFCGFRSYGKKEAQLLIKLNCLPCVFASPDGPDTIATQHK